MKRYPLEKHTKPMTTINAAIKGYTIKWILPRKEIIL